MPILRSPVLSALLVTFLWSTSWVLIKIGLDDLPPLTFAGLRYTLAAAVLLVAALAAPRTRRALVGIPGPLRWRIVWLGVVMYAVTQAAQFVGLSLLPAATLSLVLSFTPVLVSTASGKALDEIAQGGQWVGMLVALAGAALYLAPGLGGTSGVGLLVAGVGLTANAAASLLGRAVNRDSGLSPLVVTAPSMAVGGLLTLAVGLAVEPAPRLTAGSWTILLWLAVVNTAFAFTLWNHTLRHLTATESSTINNTMLVQIALLAWLVLAETPSALEWCGIGLATIGVYVVQRTRARPSAPAASRVR